MAINSAGEIFAGTLGGVLIAIGIGVADRKNHYSVPSKYRYCSSTETSRSLAPSNNAVRQKCGVLLLIASAATSVDDFLDYLFGGPPVVFSDRGEGSSGNHGLIQCQRLGTKA